MIMLLAFLALAFDLCAGSPAGDQKLLAETEQVVQMRKRYAAGQMQVVDQRRSDVAECFALRARPEYQKMAGEEKRVAERALQVIWKGCFRDLKEQFPKESLEDLAKILLPSSVTIEHDLTEIRVQLAENGMSFVLYEMEVRESLWISCVEIAQSLQWCCRRACCCCRKKD